MFPGFQRPGFPFTECVRILIVLCIKTPEQYFVVFIPSQFTVRHKYKISTSFHSVEATDMRMLVANTDMKSYITLISLNNPV